MTNRLPATGTGSDTDVPQGEMSPQDEDARVDQAAAGLRRVLEQTGDPPAQAALAQAIALLGQLHSSSRSSQVRYRVLLNAVPDAVTLHDEEGRILDANDAACACYGYTLEHLKQLSVADLNPDLPADHMRTVWATYELGETVTVETSNRHASGRRFPVEVHSNAYIDDGQRRIVAVARDVSARHRAQRELAASEKGYRLLLQAMDKGVLVHRPSGHLRSANPAACRLLGVSRDELLATSFKHDDTWHFVDDANRPLSVDELPALRAIRSRTIIESSVIGVYLPHLHRYRWFSATAVPQYDEGGELLQVITTFSDVTGLKRETEMFHTAQRLADIGCWELDDLRGTLYWTEQMYRIHDLPVNSPINETRALGFFDPEARALFASALAEARSRGRQFELELQLCSTIDRRRWVRITGQPMTRHKRIFGVVGTVQDIDERKAIEARLRHQAATDSLTDMPNRNTMLARIAEAIDQTGPGRGPALLYVDLDRFKVLNDMLGHSDGDRLLGLAAQRLRAAAEPDAETSRFGNDEFVLLLARPPDAEAAAALAARIIAAFASPFELDGERFALTTSIGIAQFPEDGSNAEDLVRHADAAMFEAKHCGRSTWRAYAAHGYDESERLQVHTLLRMALDKHEFQLVYQPQLDMQSGKVTGAEALLRWNSPQLGLVMPGAFIGEAESSGDIVRIGAWTIGEACRQLRVWRDRGVDIGRVAVNVSYRQFVSGTLASAVAAALERNHLPGEALELELTERVMIDDFADTAQTLHQLKDIGVTLMIDDFGEGFSSLNYLRHLPVDGLKISHNFLQGVPGTAVDNAICEAIIRIARSLHLQIVAEGVETEAQRRFLLDLHSPLAQGFLFARPMAGGRIPEFVAHAATV
ncbi:MAG TPA: EAL domain-containing protein [Rhodanobacteraceae bacterium]|nr:EAL domain-containing protein [Rhodanobacteraceae bacterium]